MSYDFHAPTALAEALELAAAYGEDAHFMAGGTSLVLLMGQGLVRPGHVVGLRGLTELRGITKDADGTLRIGALVTHREAERSPEVRAHCTALGDTFGHVATVRIRNQATLGGNLVHADPAQDPPPMLLALDASLSVASRSGERSVALDGFFTDTFATALEPGEIVREIRVPPLATGARACYLKFLPRTADDYATVSVAAVASGGIVRVALGGVGPTPLRARAVERAIASGAAIGDAVAAVVDDIDPLDDGRGSAAYKRTMARVWTARALREVLG